MIKPEECDKSSNFTEAYLQKPAMKARITIVPDSEMPEVQQAHSTGMGVDGKRGVESRHLGGSESSASAVRSAKWTDWMDRALFRQVLATDPINCGRGRTVVKWVEVVQVLHRLER